MSEQPSQTQRIVQVLRSRSPHWVPLAEILALRISQYSVRIHQARHECGLNIENRVDIVNGVKHSWFRLIEAKPEFSFTPSGDSWLETERLTRARACPLFAGGGQ